MGYKVDLKTFMARCEANYQRLWQVFPDLASQSKRCLGLANAPDREVVISVQERTPFTTLLSVKEVRSGVSLALTRRWFQAPVIQVRMYHDAKLAEVVSCDRIRNVAPKNPYPNKAMLQADEKAQWNRFLEEWLAACLEHGYVNASAALELDDSV